MSVEIDILATSELDVEEVTWYVEVYIGIRLVGMTSLPPCLINRDGPTHISRDLL